MLGSTFKQILKFLKRKYYKYKDHKTNVLLPAGIQTLEPLQKMHCRHCKH